MANLYKIMGVNPEDDATIIKRRYRQLARELHPDVNGGDQEKTERFQRIATAYAILGNEQRRAAYDRKRASAPVGTPGNVFGHKFDDLVDRVASEGITTENWQELFTDLFDAAKDFQSDAPNQMRRAAEKIKQQKTYKTGGVLDVLEDLFGIESPEEK